MSSPLAYSSPETTLPPYSVPVSQMLPPSTLTPFASEGHQPAASAGVADSTIQILGRWTSDAYRRYIRISDDFACDLTRRVASVNSCTRHWDTDNSRSV